MDIGGLSGMKKKIIWIDIWVSVLFNIFFFEWKDPFVKIYLMNGKKRIAKKKTTVQKSTLSPYFNEAFTFELHSSLIQVTSFSN